MGLRLATLALALLGACSSTDPDPPIDPPGDAGPDGNLELTATADLYALDEDGSLDLDATLGVLDNDVLATSAVLESGPMHGVLELELDGSFTYTPDLHYNGPDEFRYRASDGTLTTEPVSVTIAVVPIDDPPTANDDEYLMNEDTSLVVAASAGVLANDLDIDSPLGAAVVITQPEDGTLTFGADGGFTYTPDDDFAGIDSFRYTVAGLAPIDVSIRVENTHDTTFVRRGGGTDSDAGLVAAAAGLDTWVAGTFRGSAQFDLTTLVSTGTGMYISRHTTSGLIDRMIAVSSTAEVTPADLELYPDGGVVVAGTMRGTTTFGAGETNETVLTAQFSDPFVARFSETGALVWARFATDDGNGFNSGVAVGKDGEVYVTGDQDSAMTFSPGLPDQLVFAATGSPAFYVARYEAAGTLTWVKGGNGHAFGNTVDVIADGSLVVMGGLRGGTPLTLGVGEANETTLDGGNFDPFFARYETTGALRSAKRGARCVVGLGMGAESAFVHSDGSMFVTGVFTDLVTFGEGEANETVLTPVGFSSFIASYAADGTFAWARRIASSASSASRGYDVVRMSDGGVVAVGHLSGTVTLGEGEPNETSLTSAGSVDIFYARYRADGELRWAKRAGGTGFDEALAVTRNQFDALFITGMFGTTATFGIGDVGETSLTRAGTNITTDAFVFGLAL